MLCAAGLAGNCGTWTTSVQRRVPQHNREGWLYLMRQVHCNRDDWIVIHDLEHPDCTLTLPAEVLWPKREAQELADLEEQVNDLKLELERKESELADLRAERDSKDD